MLKILLLILLKLKFVKYLMVEVSNSSEVVGRLSQTNFYNYSYNYYSSFLATHTNNNNNYYYCSY